LRITSNAGRPWYKFNSDKYATVIGDNATAVDALKLITAVPNPYYAYSEYETDRLDNRIKIINLPVTCTVKIYSTDGVLMRTITKDDPNTTYLEWDLKNTSNITVASGIYIIHVDAPGIGERVVKWFGLMRPIDLDSF
jgi:flagellar hook assembly protein FlgD